MLTKNIALLLLVGLLGMSSCAPILIYTPPPAPRQPETRNENRQAFNIPKGHLPPPVSCRIWYPNRPAGQQPPPQRCPIPVNQVPLGAYVVSRVEGEEKRALVKIYDQVKPGIVIETRYAQVVD